MKKAREEAGSLRMTDTLGAEETDSDEGEWDVVRQRRPRDTEMKREGVASDRARDLKSEGLQQRGSSGGAEADDGKGWQGNSEKAMEPGSERSRTLDGDESARLRKRVGRGRAGEVV